MRSDQQAKARPERGGVALPASLLASLVLLPGLALTWAAVGWTQQKNWVWALGLLLSFGLALVIWLLASGRARALALAEQMTAELELLARVARSTSNSVFSTDPHLRILWVNEAFTRITGYSAEAALGRLPIELFGTELSDPRTQQVLTEAVAAGVGCRVEILQRHALGHAYWMAVELQPVRDAAGVLRGFIDIGTDVTERRALEAAMQRGHTLLQSVVDNLPCGLAVYDGELQLITHNAQFRRLLDLPDRLFEGAPPRLQEIVRFNLQRGEYGQGAKAQAIADGYLAFARQPREVTRERLRPNGSVLEQRAAVLPGGGFITTFVDMSERRQAQAAMERSEQLLRSAIDALDEAFVLFDSEDKLVFCNEKYRSVYANVAELLRPGVSFEQIVRARARLGSHPEAIGREDEWVAERVALHRAGATTMVQRLDNGRWLRVIERKTPDGHVAGFRIDITDLMRATEAAEKASLAKGQFLANMSHEIRTPMNAVLGMLKLLQKTPLSERQRDYVLKTDGAARSLLGLLNDILDFSKVEAGKMSLDLQPMRIDELLRDLAVILSANVGRKNVELLFELDPGLPSCVVADALRLQQVLVNLAGNAIKFTERGQVTVQIRRVGQGEGFVELELGVSDTGLGIAPEHQQQIFTGFSQAEASTSRRFGGTGLGLAISQRLVALMGADLRLESELGQGSRFHFRLRLALPEGATDEPEQGLFDGFLGKPVSALQLQEVVDAAHHARAAAAHLAQVSRGPASPPRRLAGLRLLLVEDNLNNQQIARELLEDEGAAVVLAADGQQALSLLAHAKRERNIDAVLMDVQMPVMDGYTATRLIRRQLGLTLPIIAMTANALASERQACLDAGMSEHVGKPFDVDHLVSVLLRQCSGDPDAQASAGAERHWPASILAQARRAGIELAEALDRLSGKTELFERMVAALSENAQTLPQALAGTPAAAVAALHGFRGLAATLGAAMLATLATEGEHAWRDGTPLAPDWRTRFDAVLQRDLAALADLARQLRSELAPAPPVASADLSGLPALIELLEGSDLAALDAYTGLRQALHAKRPALAAVLDVALAELNFSAAAGHCRVLLQDLHDLQEKMA